jgi:hypothetical protein
MIRPAIWAWVTFVRAKSPLSEAIFSHSLIQYTVLKSGLIASISFELTLLAFFAALQRSSRSLHIISMPFWSISMRFSRFVCRYPSLFKTVRFLSLFIFQWRSKSSWCLFLQADPFLLSILRLSSALASWSFLELPRPSVIFIFPGSGPFVLGASASPISTFRSLLQSSFRLPSSSLLDLPRGSVFFRSARFAIFLTRTSTTFTSTFQPLLRPPPPS